MKILWITNSLLPEATSLLDGDKELKGTGGWIESLADAIRCLKDIELSFASLTPLVKKLTILQGDRFTHYAIPDRGDNSYHKYYELAFIEIRKLAAPNIVHVHGTEYPHSLAALKAFGARETVFSLQGIVSAYAPYYMGGISKWDAMRSFTFRSFFRPSLMSEQRMMEKRGMYEKTLFKTCNYVIGRTSWDRAQVWAVNPQAQYFYCGEILRSCFYQGQWNYMSCKPHTIFVSQATYPLKGLHKVIEAMGVVKNVYPDVCLRVAGNDITRSGGSWKERLRLSSYGRFIKNLIVKNGLQGQVVFTGPLNAEEMKREYLQSNVFICPSNIENSPNSLAEAQILGVPCLASYVGGTPDMMRGDEKHLYRFEEVPMLAEKICEIFKQKDKVDTSAIRQIALKRHDPDDIVRELTTTYELIIVRQREQ